MESSYMFDQKKKIKALIVDPDNSSRDLLKKHLEGFPIELNETDTWICKNAEMEQASYDVIFHAVEDQIQTSSCHCCSPLDKNENHVWVALASLSMRKRHGEYLKNGYDYCALKPLETDMINKIMNQIMLKRRK